MKSAVVGNPPIRYVGVGWWLLGALGTCWLAMPCRAFSIDPCISLCYLLGYFLLSLWFSFNCINISYIDLSSVLHFTFYTHAHAHTPTPTHSIDIYVYIQIYSLAPWLWWNYTCIVLQNQCRVELMYQELRRVGVEKKKKFNTVPHFYHAFIYDTAGDKWVEIMKVCRGKYNSIQ